MQLTAKAIDFKPLDMFYCQKLRIVFWHRALDMVSICISLSPSLSAVGMSLLYRDKLVSH